MTSKPGGNLQRPAGPWKVIGSKGKTPEGVTVPKKGWFLFSGKNAMETALFYNGQKVEYVTSLEYTVDATTQIPRLKLEIVAPSIRFGHANG